MHQNNRTHLEVFFESETDLPGRLMAAPGEREVAISYISERRAARRHPESVVAERVFRDGF